MPIRDHSNSRSDHFAPRRIGADNDIVFDSFDVADMGNTTNSRVTGDIASGNTNLTRAFNMARIGNSFGGDVGQIEDGASTDQNVYITTITEYSAEA